MSAHVISAMIR